MASTPAPATAAEPLPERADVVIVGGGAIGASIAFHLAEAGAGRVLLLERDRPASGSSGKPIGGVRARFSDPLTIRLGLRGLTAWRDFARRPGADIGLTTVGYLFLLADDREPAVFTEGVETQNRHGVPSRIVDPRTARELCPYAAPRSLVAAAFSPTDGHALPRAAVAGHPRAAHAPPRGPPHLTRPAPVPPPSPRSCVWSPPGNCAPRSPAGCPSCTAPKSPRTPRCWR